ncbi:UNVERIFIED_CONTAM: hypothetical protein GTU68_041833 [Idotea baltica]|nr:hypothetical protein [Idotea baltica]
MPGVSTPDSSASDTATSDKTLPTGPSTDVVATTPFAFETVIKRARALASEPYSAPAIVPAAATKLDYDAYRRIEFVQNETDFSEDTKSDFRVLYDPAGFLFKTAVKINLIQDGAVKPRLYVPSDFNFFDLDLTDEVKQELGYAGFRIVTPLNKAGKFDEMASFKGASFFRVLGTATSYGASSRGLSIATGSPKGEEFPEFREFWIEHGVDHNLVVYALLDSPSVAGAYQFSFTPGNDTRVDVKSVLAPRKELTSFGIAPLTSMFDLGPQDPAPERGDYRPRVHDSEGLLARLSNGEWIWRPLANPSNLEISGFSAETPMGFGLSQRTRDFDAYDDLEARYHLRPSVWIEPAQDWGAGALTLVEIPTNNEFNDNIVAFFKPEAPLKPGEEKAFGYRMSWGLSASPHPGVARAASTRTGLAPNSRNRVFLIDFESDNPELLKDVEPVVDASGGAVSNITLTPNPHTGGLRLSFELEPKGESLIELRASLTRAKRTTSETWLYRWTP